MSAVFLNDWSESGVDGLKRDFNIDDAALEGVEIIVASYLYEGYSGSAYVLFRKDGKLFEVEGGHCSCYGLSECGYSGDSETQWTPSEVTVDRLRDLVAAEFDPFVGGKLVVEEFLKTA